MSEEGYSFMLAYVAILLDLEGGYVGDTNGLVEVYCIRVEAIGRWDMAVSTMNVLLLEYY